MLFWVGAKFKTRPKGPVLVAGLFFSPLLKWSNLKNVNNQESAKLVNLATIGASDNWAKAGDFQVCKG